MSGANLLLLTVCMHMSPYAVAGIARSLRRAEPRSRRCDRLRIMSKPGQGYTAECAFLWCRILGVVATRVPIEGRRLAFIQRLIPRHDGKSDGATERDRWQPCARRVLIESLLELF